MRSFRAATLLQQLSSASWVVPMARGYGLSADVLCSISSRILDTTYKSLTIQHISFGRSWFECQKLQSFWTPPATWAASDTTAKALAAPDKPSMMRLSETRTQKMCNQAAYQHTLSAYQSQLQVQRQSRCSTAETKPKQAAWEELVLVDLILCRLRLEKWRRWNSPIVANKIWLGRLSYRLTREGWGGVDRCKTFHSLLYKSFWTQPAKYFYTLPLDLIEIIS